MKIMNIGYDKIIRFIFIFIFFGLIVPLNNYYLNFTLISLITFISLYEWKYTIKDKLYGYSKKSYYIIGFLTVIIPYALSLFFIEQSPGILVFLFLISIISNFLLNYFNKISGNNPIFITCMKKNTLEGVIGSFIFSSIIIYYLNGHFNFMTLSEEKGFLFILFLTFFSLVFRVLVQKFKKEVGFNDLIGSDLLKSRIVLEYFINTNLLILSFIPIYLIFKY